MDPLTLAAAKGCGSIAGKFAAAKVKEWFDYVNAYDENLKKFKRLHELLVSKENDIKARVVTGERGGEQVSAQVQKWLDWAEELLKKFINIRDAEEDYRELFMDEEARKTHDKCCFKLVGCNPKFRHHLSSKAKELADLIEVRIHELDGSMNNLTISTGPPSIGSIGQGDFCQLLESRQRDVENIMEALKNNTINRIGIHGMGGAGKTVLANEVARRAEQKKLFNQIVLVEISHSPNIKQIQDQIAERIGYPLNGIRTIEERGLHLYNRLKVIRSTKKLKNDNQEAQGLEKLLPSLKSNTSNDEKQSKSGECGNLLIILDNIWSKQDLRNFGIGYELATDLKCKVVITSRQEDVCKKMGATHPYIYKVGDLNHNEAEILFKEKVGDTLQRHPKYEEIMKTLLSKCSRLPLSLSILANTLKNQGLDFWESMDRKLKKYGQGEAVGILSETYFIIEMSYKNIENTQKKRLFLLCCLFPAGSSIYMVDLLRYGIGLGLFQDMNSLSDALEEIQNWVDELTSSSLLIEIDAQKEMIKIHDDVREAGRFIATHSQGEFFSFHVGKMPGWLEKEKEHQYSAITMVCDDNYNCLPYLHLPNLQLLRLEGASKLNDDYFLKMKNIKVLHLPQLDSNNFPSSIDQLNNIQTLLLEGCMLDDISWICKLTTLQVLSLKESSIRKLPEEVGKLVKLKLLDLTDCGKLKYIPAGSLGKLTQLEGLYMMHSFDGWAVEAGEMASISELKNCSSLQVLEIKIRSTMQLVDRDFPFKNLALSRFRIGLGIFPIWTPIKRVELRRYVHVRNITSDDLLNEGWKSMMRKVEYISLTELDCLSWRRKSLPDMNFRELKCLVLMFVSGIEYVLPAADCCKGLELLQVENCKNLKYIVQAPVQFDKIDFPCLEMLILKNLPSLMGLCKDMSSGNAEQGRALKTLFTKKVKFPCLECLTMESIDIIEQLWSMKSGNEFSTSFPQLKSIYINFMPKLKNVWSEKIIHIHKSVESSTVSSPPSEVINGLQLLTRLSINNCHAMKQIITSEASNEELEDSRGTSILCFPELLSLYLHDMGNLVCFYDGTQDIEFPALEHLGLKDLHSFETFVKIGQHSGYANYDDDGSIVSDHAEFITPDRANILFISARTIFPSIKTVSLLSLHNVELLWDTINDQQLHKAFPKLQSLRLWNMNRLKYVWDKERGCRSSFPNIKDLGVFDCGSIESVFPPSTANEFKRLENLTIKGCPKLKQVISTEVIDDRGSLSDIVPDNIIRLPKLSSLTLQLLKTFTCFYQGRFSIEFQVLQEMHLLGLGNLITFAKPFQPYWSDDEPAGGYDVNDAAASDASRAGASLFFRDKVLLHSLKKLLLETVDNIETIWDIGDCEEVGMKLPNLEFLSISRMPELRVVWWGANIKNLSGRSKELRTLRVENLPMIQVLVGKAGNGNNCAMVALFDGELEFPVLEDLTIMQMANLDELVDTSDKQKEEDASLLVLFPNLKKLDLRTCPVLKWEHVPQDILNSLSSLSVYGFSRLVRMFSATSSYKLGGGFCIRSQLENLEELTIRGCGSMEELFGDHDEIDDTTIYMLPKLKTLKLFTLHKLNSVPCHMLPRLENLEIRKCQVVNKFLVSASASAKKSGNLVLQQLENLTIRDCDNLESVVAAKGVEQMDDHSDEIELPKLEAVTLTGLTSLCSFSSSHHHLGLPSLKYFNVFGCHNLRSFSFGNLLAPGLRRVVVEGEVNETNEDLNTILAARTDKYMVVAKCPRISYSHDHHRRHPLLLHRAEGPYTCDYCTQDGEEWLYTCHDCSFKLHPFCVSDVRCPLLMNFRTTRNEVPSIASDHRRPLLPPKEWPATAESFLHSVRHPLKLTTGRKLTKCGVCNGSTPGYSPSPPTTFSFSCLSCNFDAHLRCVFVPRLPCTTESTTQESCASKTIVSHSTC